MVSQNVESPMETGPVSTVSSVVAVTLPPGETAANPQSKNHLKKLKKLEKYAEIRKERRKRERERQKQKRQAAVAQGLPARPGPSRKELKKRLNAAAKDGAAVSIAIDLDYDDLMSERDIAKCIKQCLRMYTINRRSTRPCQMHFTGIKQDGRIHSVLKKNDGWENWHVKYHFNETHLQVFEREKLVYLTCESDTVLDKLEPGVTYVIGGLVDHNHQKGLCHDRAQQAGLKTARLPLSEHVDMKTRAVLATFHVFELLLRVAAGQPWTQAILETMPQRKGAKPKRQVEQEQQKGLEQQLKKEELDEDKIKNEKNVEQPNGSTDINENRSEYNFIH